MYCFFIIMNLIFHVEYQHNSTSPQPTMPAPFAPHRLFGEVSERFPTLSSDDVRRLISLAQEYYATAKPAIRVLELFDIVCCIDAPRVTYFKECVPGTPFWDFYDSVVERI